MGFIAQELEKSFPQLVHTNQEGEKSVDYSRMAPILVEAIKEQQVQIEQLKSEKAALEVEIKTLRSEVMTRLEALENKASSSSPGSK